jgi:hypothetical protein
MFGLSEMTRIPTMTSSATPTTCGLEVTQLLEQVKDSVKQLVAQHRNASENSSNFIQLFKEIQNDLVSIAISMQGFEVPEGATNLISSASSTSSLDLDPTQAEEYKLKSENARIKLELSFSKATVQCLRSQNTDLRKQMVEMVLYDLFFFILLTPLFSLRISITINRYFFL